MSKHRMYWLCALLGHDFVFENDTSWRAHCSRKKCGERWGD